MSLIRLDPMIYRLRKDKEGYYFLEPSNYKFEIKTKIYGTVLKDVELYWKAYNSRLGTLGVMFTGDKGSGKSTTGELLCNKAIDNGIAVVFVSEIDADIKTVEYLSMLKNIVLFFDEFGKNFNRPLQDKMLSMLSGVDSGKKLVIITENHMNLISEFIQNRPGRIRYHKDYSRVDKETLDELCSDYNLPGKFYKEILKLWETSTTFAIDHLTALVEECLFTPDHDFETIMERMNVSKPGVRHLVVSKIIDTNTKKEVDFTVDNKIPLDKFKNRWRYAAFVTPKEDSKKNVPDQPPSPFGRDRGKRVDFNISDLIKFIDDKYILNSSGYIIELEDEVNIPVDLSDYDY